MGLGRRRDVMCLEVAHWNAKFGFEIEISIYHNVRTRSIDTWPLGSTIPFKLRQMASLDSKLAIPPDL